MAIVQIGLTRGGNIKEFLGLTADTKPTENVGPGSTYLEKDGEKRIFMFDGIGWNEL